MLWFSHILILSCTELFGVSVAMDTGAGYYGSCSDLLPIGSCTTLLGNPIEYAPGECYLPIPMQHWAYEEYWCQNVTLPNDPPLAIQNPCLGMEGLMATADAPYVLRQHWAQGECPVFFEFYGWCSLANECRAQDKLNGECACTAEDEINHLCTAPRVCDEEAYANDWCPHPRPEP